MYISLWGESNWTQTELQEDVASPLLNCTLEPFAFVTTKEVFLPGPWDFQQHSEPSRGRYRAVLSIFNFVDQAIALC